MIKMLMMMICSFIRKTVTMPLSQSDIFLGRPGFLITVGGNFRSLQKWIIRLHKAGDLVL